MAKTFADSIYMSRDKNETTFKYDTQIAKLPTQSLKESIDKLLVSIKPLTETEQQYLDVVSKASKFIRDPLILAAQEKLLKLAEDNDNWLESWWLEYAYLRSRQPLIPYSNMAAPMSRLDYWPVLHTDGLDTDLIQNENRLSRASLSIYFTIKFWKMLVTERMRPQIFKGVPWSMSQFKSVFTTTRLPGLEVDVILNLFESSSTGKFSKQPETHLIVLCRGYIFKLEFVIVKKLEEDDSYTLIIRPAPQIAKQLAFIQSWCQSQTSSGPGVGALTSLGRSEWARARQSLRNLSKNNESVCDIIERSVCVVVLDEESPADMSQQILHSMSGDVRNRWADKSITLISFKNGMFGASADHTNFDGGCSGSLTTYIQLSLNQIKGTWNDLLIDENWMSLPENVRNDVPMPQLLKFDVNDELTISIGTAVKQAKEAINTIDAVYNRFKEFGKEKMKELNIHPEAFFQTALHLAYYKVHKKPAPAYVTATLRRFINGRTETCRSCYPEMLEFVKHFSTHNLNAEREKSYELLKLSANKFLELMKEASSGKGYDRHLLVLYLLAQQIANEKGHTFDIELYNDPLFQKASAFVLSTSLTGYWDVCGGLPPLVKHGYACFYGISDNFISFCVCSYTDSTSNIQELNRCVNESLIELRDLIECSKKLSSKL